MIRVLLTAFLTVYAAGAAVAHEYWVEPDTYVLEPGESVKANLRNGQDFKGGRLPWLDRRFVSFRIADSDGLRDLDGTNGDVPAVTLTPAEGLTVLAYHSQPDTLEFRDFEKFEDYVAYEGLDWAVAKHRADGLPDSGFRERYQRNAKALIQSGPYAGGADQATGLPFELVVDGSPYKPEVNEVSVRLFWQGSPVADWPINVFTRAQGAEASLEQVRTDAEGRAVVPFLGEVDVLLNAVWLERSADEEFAWESWWASTTFGRVGRGG